MSKIASAIAVVTHISKKILYGGVYFVRSGDSNSDFLGGR